MPKITPFLWFDHQAEEAVNFYTSLFKNSKIISSSRFPDARPEAQGSILSITFTIDGLEMTAFNGGPYDQFNNSISLFVNCDNQEEVDRLWAALSEGGEEQQCGWVKDRYGLVWQIVPTLLMKLMGDPDPVKAQRVTAAMLKMVKLDCALLQQAYDQA